MPNTTIVDVRMYAPFFVDGPWRWVRFSTDTGNTHQACADHASKIGATMWDPSQASVMIAGSVVQGHPTVFH